MGRMDREELLEARGRLEAFLELLLPLLGGPNVAAGDPFISRGLLLEEGQKTGAARKASIVARVLGWLSTALPAKARARAWRSHGFRLNLRAGRPANFSIWSNSKMRTYCRSLSVNGRSPHDSRPGIRLDKKPDHYDRSPCR